MRKLLTGGLERKAVVTVKGKELEVNLNNDSKEVGGGSVGLLDKEKTVPIKGL
jgi:hypothetical protein